MSFASIVHLFGKYRTLAKFRPLVAWIRKEGASGWHETPIDNSGRRVIIVDSGNKLKLFGMEIEWNAPLNDLPPQTNVLQIKEIDLLERGIPSELARLRLYNQFGAETLKLGLIVLCPFIDFEKDQFGWEAEIIQDDKIVLLQMTGEQYVEKNSREFPIYKREHPTVASLLVDDLDSNELHHLDLMKAEAVAWTKDATSISDMAKQIWIKVMSLWSYNDKIEKIVAFTHSDRLSRDVYGRKGVCDEFAVCQVSYLRAVGIPARIKWLTWTKSDNTPAAHACVEYQVGIHWLHMDALWHAFNNPAEYRQSGGAQNVKVMDADYPLDSRSSSPQYGYPDPAGDEMLGSYTDFILNPSYPGEARPGYSYDAVSINEIVRVRNGQELASSVR